MKKKLLLMAAFMTALVGVNAQNSITFDDYVGEINQDINHGIFTLAASDSRKMEVDANKSIFSNGETYTTRLKFGGNSHAEGRYILVDCQSSGVLKVGVRSGSNSDESRSLTAELDGTTIFNQIIKEADAENYGNDEEDNIYPIVEISVSEAGEVKLTTTNGALNFYYLEFVEGDVDPTDPTDPQEPGEAISESVVFDDYVGLITENKAIGVFTLIASDSRSMEVDANSAKFTSGETYTTRLKLGGTTHAEGRYITAEFPTAGTLTIGARTGSNSAEDRNLVVTFNGNVIYDEVVKEADATKEQYVNDQGEEDERNVYPIIEIAIDEPGDAKIEAPKGSLNFYYLAFESENYNGGGTSIEDTVSDLEVIATTYYNVAGVQFTAPQKGLNIIKETYEDGSVKVSKAYIK